MSLRNGDVDPAANESTGVYWRDTRYCSEFKLTIAGVPPVLLDEVETGALHTAVFTNPPLRDPIGRSVEPRTFLIRRRRLVLDGLHEFVSISSYSNQRESIDIRFDFAADFADIFEVRGMTPEGERAAIDCVVGESGVTYSYVGRDEARRAGELRFTPQPDHIGATSALFAIELEPGESIDLLATVSPLPGSGSESFPDHLGAVRQRETDWLESLTSIETDHEILNECLRRSLLDIDALRTQVDGEEFIAAGVPWFDTLFGRDSLITGMLLAPYSVTTLRSSLAILAAHQAHGTDPSRDAQPGKIPHELRWGELSRAGIVPFGQYYGSVDATPLFLIAVAEYARWCDDEPFLRQLDGPVRAALEWCERSIGADGLLSYERATVAGLENQGWKDSFDATVWPDGSAIRHPIALVEVQAYAAAAGAACVELARFLGDDLRPRGEALQACALRALATRFEDPDLGYAFCVDGEANAVPLAASNAGHVLWAGAATAPAAARVASRLLREDLFTGWGIRTMSAQTRSFNPLGYHTGSVWPHDNALIAAGMRRYGLDEQALRLVNALLDAALAFPAYRLPELFCGDSRDLQLVPTPYPVASRPQAWSSAAVPSLLMTCLGVRALSPNELLVGRPLLPMRLEWLRLRNLHFGNSSVDLNFRRDGSAVRVEVEAIRGGGRVVVQAGTQPPL